MQILFSPLKVSSSSSIQRAYSTRWRRVVSIVSTFLFPVFFYYYFTHFCSLSLSLCHSRLIFFHHSVFSLGGTLAKFKYRLFVCFCVFLSATIGFAFCGRGEGCITSHPCFCFCVFILLFLLVWCCFVHYWWLAGVTHQMETSWFEIAKKPIRSALIFYTHTRITQSGPDVLDHKKKNSAFCLVSTSRPVKHWHL